MGPGEPKRSFHLLTGLWAASVSGGSRVCGFGLSAVKDSSSQDRSQAELQGKLWSSSQLLTKDFRLLGTFLGVQAPS